ncbi:MAG: hypothetical protein GF387_00200 [Candidatus Portnoybacteria bacterium]|nr:hypothetical protein [Candidatus Portnoybacteria bacterium]
MKKLFLFLIILLLITPFSASAFLDGPIVPCGRDLDGSGQLEKSEQCTFCHIFEMAKNIIDFIIELLIVVVPLFVVIGGFMILTSRGTPEGVSKGKKIITSAIIGLVIALLSWTILGMIFNALVGPEGFPWPWNEVQCEGGGLTEEDEYEDQPPVVEDRCDEMSIAGYCLGDYYCQRGVIDQIKDMTQEMDIFLDCMKDKISNNAKEISSISDNSGGRCFEEWNGKCSSGTDSCTGECCGHSQYSLHYGGSGCRGTSYAIDFAQEGSYEEIKAAAQQCAEKSGFGQIDVINEGDHVHVELDQVARNKGCI